MASTTRGNDTRGDKPAQATLNLKDRRVKTPPSPLSSPPPSAVRRRAELGSNLINPETLSERTAQDDELDIMLSAMDADEAKAIDRKKAIRDRFAAMDEDERQQFVRAVYNRFAGERYDSYMTETGHYPAIGRCLRKEVGAHTFQLPVLDISAGTGFPLAAFLEEINRKHLINGEPVPLISDTYRGPLVYVNDIADMMIVRAEVRMDALRNKLYQEAENMGLAAPPIFTGFSNGESITYKNYSFRKLHGSLKKRFGTIIVSQTFHIVSYKDKENLAKAINWALAPGGRVILLEEFDWKTTPKLTKGAPPSVIRVVGAIASPMKTKKELIMLFKDSGGVPYDMVSRSIERIDREDPNHEMTVTILQKPDPDNVTIPLWF